MIGVHCIKFPNQNHYVGGKKKLSSNRERRERREGEGGKEKGKIKEKEKRRRRREGEGGGGGGGKEGREGESIVRARKRKNPAITAYHPGRRYSELQRALKSRDSVLMSVLASEFSQVSVLVTVISSFLKLAAQPWFCCEVS